MVKNNPTVQVKINTKVKRKPMIQAAIGTKLQVVTNLHQANITNINIQVITIHRRKITMVIKGMIMLEGSTYLVTLSNLNSSTKNTKTGS